MRNQFDNNVNYRKPSINYRQYPGQKNIPGFIHKIINEIPASTDFYELFAGSAAVSRFLSVRTPGVQFHINDADPKVISEYNCSYPPGSKITNTPALEILKTVPAVGSMVFLDPPYHHDCRAGNTELYNYEMTGADHEELLLAVRDLECNCMVVHPQHKLYDLVLQSFRKVQVTVRYHSKTSREVLYMNYPRPVQLLSYDLYGTDCWDRQRIKRKGDRLIKKLMSLPVLERNYILNRLSAITLNNGQSKN